MITDMIAPPVPEIEQGYDQRSAPRFLSVFRPVAMRIGGTHSMCVIRNISSSGMCGRIYGSLPVGTVVSVGLSLNDVLTGQVAWSDGIDIGVSFDRWIDVPRFLKTLAQPDSDGKIQRSPRVRVQRTVELHLPDRTFRVGLYDISQSGVRVETGSLHHAEQVSLEIPGLGTKRATVRWRTAEFAGLSFFQPIRLGSLIEWVNGEKPEKLATAKCRSLA